MIVKRLGVFSFAKISGILYALMGFIIGLLFSFISLVAGSIGGGLGNSGMAGMLFGVGAIIFLPIFYGVMGFIFSAFFAWIYNVIASWVGGFEVEFEDNQPVPPETFVPPTV